MHLRILAWGLFALGLPARGTAPTADTSSHRLAIRTARLIDVAPARTGLQVMRYQKNVQSNSPCDAARWNPRRHP